MKTKYLFTSLGVFFCFISLVKAQSTVLINPAKIDSLQQLIDSRPRADEEKVRLLNEYARLCFYNQEYLKGFIATRDAREFSKKLNFKGGQIMYYVTLAAFIGGGESYAYNLMQAKNIVREANNQFSEYNITLDIPAGYPVNRDQSLLDKLKPVLHYFEQQGDIEIQMTILDPIARSNYNLGRLNEVKTNLKRVIKISSDLNLRYLAATRLSLLLNSEGKMEEAKKIEQEMIELLTKENSKSENAFINYVQADNYNNKGQYALAIDYYLKSEDAFEEKGDLNMLFEIYSKLGWAYENLDMNSKALEVYEKYIVLFKKSRDEFGLRFAYNRPVFPLYALKRYDEARKYMTLSLKGAKGQNKILLEAKSNSLEGQILKDKGDYKDAITYLLKTYETYSKLEDDNGAKYTISYTLLYMTECYKGMGDMKNALKYALECLEKENKLNHNRTIIKSKISFLIADIYIETGKAEKAFTFLRLYRDIAEEQNKTESANKVAEAEIRSIIDKSEKQIDLLEKEKIQKIQQSKIQRVWIFSIIGALLSALLLSFILYRNNKNKQKANNLLHRQKEEIDLQRSKAESTLNELKATQAQLIQSEKMASLGELTAGIAHEIQNPLNFVNNYAEVNVELLEELIAEGGRDDGEKDERLIEELVSDLRDNEAKILLHGKRADTIVRGMLQHSRTSSGTKEPTNLNALADEYLRLAYHGLRAKDSSFQADFSTDFDENLPLVEVVPQDIGRVLLNIINNAFQACAERSQSTTHELQADGNSGYQPAVTVSTRKLKDSIEIRITDNGNGIPKDIKEKIFQPFFTTKPTGSGTGLGLSLAFDIVKAHGGTLGAESIQHSGTTFSLKLPITSD